VLSQVPTEASDVSQPPAHRDETAMSGAQHLTLYFDSSDRMSGPPTPAIRSNPRGFRQPAWARAVGNAHRGSQLHIAFSPERDSSMPAYVHRDM